jgi:hypothetical protein
VQLGNEVKNLSDLEKFGPDRERLIGTDLPIAKFVAVEKLENVHIVIV